MNGTSHTADELLSTAKRRKRVLELRKEGRTYRDIASELEDEFGDVALPGGWDERYAAKDLRRALQKVRSDLEETAADVRSMELRRLDELLSGLWPDATDGDTDAVSAVLRVMKRRAKMLGIDEPEEFAQVVELVESEEYRKARRAIMQALEDFPEARAAVADALETLNSDESP